MELCAGPGDRAIRTYQGFADALLTDIHLQSLEFLVALDLCPYPIARLDAARPWELRGSQIAVCRNAIHCLNPEQVHGMFDAAAISQIPLLLIGPLDPSDPITAKFAEDYPQVNIHSLAKVLEIAAAHGLSCEAKGEFADGDFAMYGKVTALRLS